MGKQEPKTIGLVAILSLGFIALIFSVTNPAMAKIGAAFPNDNVALVATIFTLPVVVFTLLSGYLAGQGKVKYKLLAIVGSTLTLIGGVAPAFLNSSFTEILVWRCVMGAGLGIFSPIANALILKLYEGEKQAKYLGWVTLLMNIGGIVFTMLGGVLADAGGANGWAWSFWGYGLAAITVVLSFFIPEPPKEEAPSKTETTAKESMGPAAWIIGIAYLIIQIFNFPGIMYLSNLFQMRGIGGDLYSTVAATVLTCTTIGGVVSGMTFGPLLKVMKRWLIPFSFAIGAAGIFVVYISYNVILSAVGAFFWGFGTFLIMPTAFMLVGMWTPASKVPIATSVVLAFTNLGAFFCTYYLQALASIVGAANLIPTSFLLLAICFAVGAVIFAFANPFPKVPAAPAQEAKK